MTGQADPQLLEVGRIGKAHGLKGEVVVDFTTDRVVERTAPGTELHAGDRVLRIVDSRPHQKRWLVTFEGVADRNQAEALRGLTLRAPAFDDPDALFVHDLIGKVLVDQHGQEHGQIVSVVDNPASDLLELGDGRLVPLAFYVDHDDERVAVSVPPGLLDDGEAVTVARDSNNASAADALDDGGTGGTVADGRTRGVGDAGG